MRLVRWVALAVFPLSLSVAEAQDVSDSHREAAMELLEVTKSRELLENSPQMVMATLAASNPTFAAEFRDVLMDFYTEMYTWTRWEPEYTRLYVEVFTESELRGLTEFYRTEMGQMVLLRMPELMQQIMALIQTTVQEGVPRLEEMIREERNRRQQ